MKIFLIVIICFALIMGFFFLNQQPNKHSTPGFVTAKGRSLYRDNQLFRSIGVNRYNLLAQATPNGNTGCANVFTNAQIDTMFSQLHSLGVTSVRFWLFQSFTQGGDDTSRFDYVLAEAKKYDLVVIPVFENHWEQCTEGDVKTAAWYKDGYQAPYGNYRFSLKDYITSIVSRYKDNPTIMMWEIMNEAQDPDEQGQYAFAKDLSSEIKSLDPNHLVSLGMTGANQDADNYQQVSSLPTLDVLDYHDYDRENQSIPDTLQDRFTVSRNLNKPLIVGESGIKEDVPDRANFFKQKMQAFFDNGGAAYMFWSYGDSDVTNDGYNFSFSSDVAQMLKEFPLSN